MHTLDGTGNDADMKYLIPLAGLCGLGRDSGLGCCCCCCGWDAVSPLLLLPFVHPSSWRILRRPGGMARDVGAAKTRSGSPPMHLANVMAPRKAIFLAV